MVVGTAASGKGKEARVRDRRSWSAGGGGFAIPNKGNLYIELERQAEGRQA